MSKNKLQYKATSELKKGYKRSKILTIIQSIAVLIMLVFAVLITIENGFSPFTVLPIVFAPMVIMGIVQMKQIKKELKRRDE